MVPIFRHSLKEAFIRVPSCKMEPRSGIIFCENRPSDLVLKLQYYHLCSIILVYMFDHPQNGSGGFIEGTEWCLVSVLKWRFLEYVWKGMEWVWRLTTLYFRLKNSFEPKIFLAQQFSDTGFFRHRISQPPNFLTK